MRSLMRFLEALIIVALVLGVLVLLALSYGSGIAAAAPSTDGIGWQGRIQICAVNPAQPTMADCRVGSGQTLFQTEDECAVTTMLAARGIAAKIQKENPKLIVIPNWLCEHVTST